MSRFTDWVEKAPPRDTYCYHVGENMKGCRTDVLTDVRLAYNAGQVTLTQRRKDGVAEYLAVKLATPRLVSDPFTIDR